MINNEITAGKLQSYIVLKFLVYSGPVWGGVFVGSKSNFLDKFKVARYSFQKLKGV
jgi:hypothetical protein